MLNKDSGAAQNKAAPILEMVQVYKASSGIDLTTNIDAFYDKVKEVPEEILYVALGIYKNKLAKDARTHPNYFFNTALKIKRNSNIKRRSRKNTEEVVVEPLVDVGRAI